MHTLECADWTSHCLLTTSIHSLTFSHLLCSLRGSVYELHHLDPFLLNSGCVWSIEAPTGELRDGGERGQCISSPALSKVSHHSDNNCFSLIP